LFRSGADLYSFRSALAQERANELGKLSESLKLERQAANVIFKFLYLSDAQVAQKKQLSLKEVGLDIARSRYSQGKISLQELQKIEVDLSQQRNLWRNAQMEFAENRVELLAFFSDSLSTKVWPLEPGQTLALGEVTELSPETQSLLETVKAKEFAWKSSRLLHLPSLDLTYEYREQPLHGRRDKIFEAGIAITIPIWSRYGVAADAAEYYAEYLGAEKSVFIQKERNLAEQNFYRTKLQLSRENLLEARGNLARAEKLYADMLNSFRLGRISANDLFLEQNRLIESELNFSQSQMAFHATAMDVCALSGKSAAVCLR
jgi:outer membrane protein TolC